MSTLSPPSVTNPHPQRAPPPSLFLGPPSRNASNISLSQNPTTAGPSTSGAPQFRSRSTRVADPAASAPLNRPRLQAPTPSQTEGERTDALWAEMQATLAEVELSAMNNNHVFGDAHSAALDELREAQIALAKAWGREEEEAAEEAETKGQNKGKQEAKKDEEDEDEDDEEGDIREARRRREENEKFFKKVSDGVEDVVSKLERVSQAMAKVERESREIWSGSDSIDSDSVAAS